MWRSIPVVFIFHQSQMIAECMTISILTMIGESLCKDAGQAAGACAVQLVGVAAALYAALPLMRTFLTMIGECL